MHNRPSRAARFVAAALAALLAFTFGGGSAFAQDAGAPPPPPGTGAGRASGLSTSIDQLTSLLIFPTTNQAGNDFANSAARLAVAVKLKINGMGRFHAIGYSRTLSAIDRAFTVDESLTRADLIPPFMTASKARKVAQVVFGTDANTGGYMLISLDKATVNTVDQSVQMTATAQVFALSSDDPLVSVTVTGKSVAAGASEPMSDVETRAIDNAAGKIVASVSPGFAATTSSTALPPTGSNKKLGGIKFMTILLVGIMAGVIIAATRTSNSGGSPASTSTSTTSGSGGTTISGPPAPPTTLFRHR